MLNKFFLVNCRGYLHIVALGVECFCFGRSPEWAGLSRFGDQTEGEEGSTVEMETFSVLWTLLFLPTTSPPAPLPLSLPKQQMIELCVSSFFPPHSRLFPTSPRKIKDIIRFAFRELCVVQQLVPTQLLIHLVAMSAHSQEEKWWNIVPRTLCTYTSLRLSVSISFTHFAVGTYLTQLSKGNDGEKVEVGWREHRCWLKSQIL